MNEKLNNVDTLDISNTQNTEEENSNREISLVEQYRNTPFIKLTVDEGVFLALGKYRLTKVFKSEEKLNEYFDENMWDMIGGLVVSLVEISLDNHQKTQE